jgi:hypothetical protein
MIVIDKIFHGKNVVFKKWIICFKPSSVNKIHKNMVPFFFPRYVILDE